MPDARACVHACLQWLETHVRVPLAGSAFDKYIATPAKEAYCEHYPQGIARCQRCKAKAREEVLKIMLEQNGDQHLCPFLYK